jgi:ribosomal protein S18 acetylase RimI-like enzyme
VVCAYRGSELVAYGIIEPATEDIPQLAVAPSMRRQGLGREILRQLLAHAATEYVKVVNVPTDSTGVVAFLESCAFVNAGGQYEMRRSL